MIPNTIVSAWFGKAEPDDMFKRCVDSWRKTNPTWNVVIVDEDTYPDLTATPYVRAALARREFVKCTELARLWGVHHLGGIYLDMDVELVGSLEPLRATPGGAFFVRQRDGMINGAAFGAERAHWAISTLLLRFPKGTDASLSALDYGPRFLTSEFATLYQSVSVLPTETFFPYDFMQKDNPPTEFGPETIGVHHWQGSWAPGWKVPK